MSTTTMYDSFVGGIPNSPAGSNTNFPGTYNQVLHLDDVYLALVTSTQTMESRVRDSLENYMANPDVQANLQQLQYDLQSWNIALTTCTNMQKNMADALKSIVSNLR